MFQVQIILQSRPRSNNNKKNKSKKLLPLMTETGYFVGGENLGIRVAHEPTRTVKAKKIASLFSYLRDGGTS